MREVLLTELYGDEVTFAGFKIQNCILYALILNPCFVFIHLQMF